MSQVSRNPIPERWADHSEAQLCKFRNTKHLEKQTDDKKFTLAKHIREAALTSCHAGPPLSQCHTFFLALSLALCSARDGS